jgi:hypothetical protein
MTGLAMLAVTAVHGGEADRVRVSTIDALTNTDWRVVRTIGELPGGVRQVVLEAKEGMADPGEEFDCCCIVSDDVPDRRLVFAGLSGDQTLLLYEEGQGRAGTHYFLTVFTTSKDRKAMEFTAEIETKRPPTTFQGLQATIVARSYCMIRGVDAAIAGAPEGNRCPRRWGGLTPG